MVDLAGANGGRKPSLEGRFARVGRAVKCRSAAGRRALPGRGPFPRQVTFETNGQGSFPTNSQRLETPAVPGSTSSRPGIIANAHSPGIRACEAVYGPADACLTAQPLLCLLGPRTGAGVQRADRPGGSALSPTPRGEGLNLPRHPRLAEPGPLAPRHRGGSSRPRTCWDVGTMDP